MLQSLLHLLQGIPAEEIVWTADITYWMAGEREIGRADPAWESEEGFLALHRQLGIMPYYYYDKFWAGEVNYSEDIQVTSEQSGRRKIRRMQTRIGTLTETSLYLPTSASVGVEKHFVETEDDLDLLLHILERRTWQPANLKDYETRRRMWQQYDGLPSLGLPRSPLSAFIYEWTGLQAGAYLMADCKDKVQAVLRLMEEQEELLLEALCKMQPTPPLVHFPDNLSSDNLSGYYDRFMAGPHVRRLERLHSAGIHAAVHLDGTVRGLLPKLIKSGFDVVEALTPQPGGDLTPEEMLKLAGDSPVILWGGVPGILFAPPYTWEDIQAHVQNLVRSWKGQPFVVGVADQVPPNGEIEFCRRIADMLGAL